MGFFVGYILGSNKDNDGDCAIPFVGEALLIYICYCILNKFKSWVLVHFTDYYYELLFLFIITTILGCRYRKRFNYDRFAENIYFYSRIISIITCVLANIIMFSQIDQTIFAEIMIWLDTKKWDISWFILSPLDYLSRIFAFSFVQFLIFKIYDLYRNETIDFTKYIAKIKKRNR